MQRSIITSPVTALIELQYLPPIAYFVFMVDKNVVIERYENFVKQTYRNRCYIVGANKVEMLSIPLMGGNRKILVKDIKIDYNQNWLNNHWRAIISAYGKAPFFEFYAQYFERIFFKKHQYLFDLNQELLSLCLKLLNVDNKISTTQKFEKKLKNSIIDTRSLIHPKNDTFVKSFFSPQHYQQVFGKNFVGNMSIIDLLFCEGPNATTIIRNSIRN